MDNTVRQLIHRFGLQPHPEGGFFRETYRCPESVPSACLPERFGAARSFCTAIYFLLPAGAKSHLHRIKSDEIWHFYLGGPLELVQISPRGEVTTVMLGQDIGGGQQVQHVVPAGCWFGAEPAPGSAFSFVGCTVSPGFDFADFEMGDRDQLLGLYPAAGAEIRRLTRP